MSKCLMSLQKWWNFLMSWYIMSCRVMSLKICLNFTAHFNVKDLFYYRTERVSMLIGLTHIQIN